LGERRWGESSILIADADADFRRVVARALTMSGLRVLEAVSGEEVLAMVRDEDVALVVLEVRLDGISGYEVCRQLRAEYGERVPIVFVSHDRTEPFDRVVGFIVGGDDYLAKPVDPDELVARVRRHLARSTGLRAKPGVALTRREREILGLLTRGLGPVEIGRDLAISPKTVATHIEHIYVKLGVHTRAQAVARAFRLELVDTSAGS
jgi:DNA-binding NarL/FixJ family response regulator